MVYQPLSQSLIYIYIYLVDHHNINNNSILHYIVAHYEISSYNWMYVYTEYITARFGASHYLCRSHAWGRITTRRTAIACLHTRPTDAASYALHNAYCNNIQWSLAAVMWLRTCVSYMLTWYLTARYTCKLTHTPAWFTSYRCHHSQWHRYDDNCLLCISRWYNDHTRVPWCCRNCIFISMIIDLTDGKYLHIPI